MPQKTIVQVRLFSHARYHFGRDEMTFVLPQNASVSDLIKMLRAAGGDKFKNIPFRIARNHEFAGEDEPIREGDELACIPPVQGG